MFRPELLYMLSMKSTILAADHLYTTPYVSLVITIALEGDIDLNLVRKSVHSKCPAEMRSYLFSWGGYLFWKRDENFKIENHINLHKDPQNLVIPVNDEYIHKLKSSLLQKPFVRNQSPWDALLVPDFVSKLGEKGTVIMLRYHHGLCDGLSIFKEIMKLSDNYEENREKAIVLPQTMYEGVKRTCLHFIPMIFVAPFVIVYDTLIHGMGNSNGWKKSAKNMKRRYNLSKTVEFPISYVKNIKNALGVSYATVVYSAMTVAIRKCMEAQNLSVPEKLTCHSPIPLPNHPDGKLTNHA